MRYAETNKNFRETRCAQTSGNFYWLLVNTAKFLMPRFSLCRTFYMLNLRFYLGVIIYNCYYQKQFTLLLYLKLMATLLLFITIYLKYEFGRSATFKK